MVIQFQGRARIDKKTFLNEQGRVVEENQRMGKTRHLFNKIGDIKGTIRAKTGTIKDRNGMDLTRSRRYSEKVARIYRITI